MYNHQTAIALLGSKSQPSEAAERLVATLVRELNEANYVTLASDEHGCLETILSVNRAAKGLVVLASAASESPGEGVKILQSSSILGRMEAILRTADAVVITDGGLDTLAILFEVWSYGASPNLPFRPVVLVGDMWADGLEALMKAGWISKSEQAMVSTVRTAQEAVESLRYYAGAGHGK